MNPQSSHPIRIIRLLEGVPPAMTLLAGMQLDLFTALQDGPLEAEALAEILDVDSNRLERLLYALAAIGVLTVTEGKFANTPECEQLLVRGQPKYIGDTSGALAAMWDWLLQTAETIRTGVPQAKHEYLEMSEEELLPFYAPFYPGAQSAGQNLGERFDFSMHRKLLDVGGGTGGVSLALVKMYPQLQATVVDLPSVTPIAHHFIAEAGMEDRVTVRAENVVEGTLQGEFDLVVMRAFTQVLSPQEIQCALRNVYRALIPGGKVYIITRVLDNSRMSPLDTVAWDLVFANIYDHGQAYTTQQYHEWLSQAGFVNFERVRPSKDHHILEGDYTLVVQKPETG